MLVDVVPMRSLGQRLSRESLLAAMPVRGYLNISRYTSTEGGPQNYGNFRTVIGARLTPEDRKLGGPSLLPYLAPAEVRSIAGNDLLIVGIEHVNEVTVNEERYPQAWWCRLVTDASTSLAALGPCTWGP